MITNFGYFCKAQLNLAIALAIETEYQTSFKSKTLSSHWLVKSSSKDQINQIDQKMKLIKSIKR